MNKNIKAILTICSIIVNFAGIFLFFMPFITAKIGTETLNNYSGFEIAFDFNGKLFKNVVEKSSFGGFVSALLPLLFFIVEFMASFTQILSESDKELKEKRETKITKYNIYFDIAVCFLVCLFVLLAKTLIGISDMEVFALGSGAKVIIIIFIASTVLRVGIDYCIIQGKKESANQDGNNNFQTTKENNNGKLCSYCGHINQNSKLFCERCGKLISTKNTNYIVANDTNKQNNVVKKEDWTCPKCGEINRFNATNCINCFEKKPE